MKVNRMSLLSKGSDYNLVMDYFMDNVSDFKYHNDYPYTKFNFLINKKEFFLTIDNGASLDDIRYFISKVIISKISVDKEEIDITIASVSGLTKEEASISFQKYTDKYYPKEEKLGLLLKLKNYIKKIVR